MEYSKLIFDFQKFSEYFIEIPQIIKKIFFYFWNLQDFPKNPKCNCQTEFCYFRIFDKNAFQKITLIYKDAFMLENYYTLNCFTSRNLKYNFCIFLAFNMDNPFFSSVLNSPKLIFLYINSEYKSSDINF